MQSILIESRGFKGKFHIYAIAVIIIMGVFIYKNTLDNEFTNWDDGELIINNIAIRSLDIENLKEIFSIKSGGTYQPMRVFSYAIDHWIGGIKPLVYHIHNMLLHIVASIILYLLLNNLLPKIIRKEEKDLNPQLYSLTQIRIIALFSALLFTVHPVNVEAVAWMSSRKYGLLAVFTFLSVFVYIKRSEKILLQIWYYSLALFFWVLAVMSSPFGIVIPALFVLVEYCCHPKKNPIFCIKENLYRFLPFIVLGICVLGYLLVKLGAGTRIQYASYDIAKTMGQVYFDYIRNFFIPLWLNNRYVDYVYLSIFSYYKVYAGFVLLLGAVAASILLINKNNDKRLFLAVFWYIIAWLPSSNIIPISTRMADRYVYLSSVGFFSSFSWSCLYVLLYGGHYLKWHDKTVMKVFFACTSALIIYYSYLSMIRCDVWQNSGTLWEDSLKKDPGNGIANNNYSMWLYKKGNLEKAKKHMLLASILMPGDDLPLKNLGRFYVEQNDFENAKKAYQKILELNSDDVIAHKSLWAIFTKLGQFEDAKKHLDFVLSDERTNVVALNQKGLILYESEDYEKAQHHFMDALMSYPNDPDLNYNLGMTLFELGSSKAALDRYEKAIELSPDFEMAYSEVGKIYFNMKHYKKAITYYEKALDINSGLAEIYSDLGNVYFAKEEFKKAAYYYDIAIELNSSLFEPYFNKCVILERTRQLNDAILAYEKGVKLFPGKAQLFNNIGSLLLQLKDYQKAEEYLLTAVEINKAFSDAHYNLGTLYQIQGKYGKAIQHYKTVLAMNTDDYKTHHKLCALLTDLGYLDDAEECFRELISLMPDNALYHFQLGIVLLKRNLKEKAIKHLKKAIKMDPGNSYFRQFLSEPST